jgi:hypothetical protein
MDRRGFLKNIGKGAAVVAGAAVIGLPEAKPALATTKVDLSKKTELELWTMQWATCAALIQSDDPYMKNRAFTHAKELIKGQQDWEREYFDACVPYLPPFTVFLKECGMMIGS